MTSVCRNDLVAKFPQQVVEKLHIAILAGTIPVDVERA